MSPARNPDPLSSRCRATLAVDGCVTEVAREHAGRGVRAVVCARSWPTALWCRVGHAGRETLKARHPGGCMVAAERCDLTVHIDTGRWNETGFVPDSMIAVPCEPDIQVPISDLMGGSICGSWEPGRMTVGRSWAQASTVDARMIGRGSTVELCFIECTGKGIPWQIPICPGRICFWPVKSYWLHTQTCPMRQSLSEADAGAAPIDIVRRTSVVAIADFRRLRFLRRISISLGCRTVGGRIYASRVGLFTHSGGPHPAAGQANPYVRQLELRNVAHRQAGITRSRGHRKDELRQHRLVLHPQRRIPPGPWTAPGVAGPALLVFPRLVLPITPGVAGTVPPLTPVEDEPRPGRSRTAHPPVPARTGSPDDVGQRATGLLPEARRGCGCEAVGHAPRA